MVALKLFLHITQRIQRTFFIKLINGNNISNEERDIIYNEARDKFISPTRKEVKFFADQNNISFDEAEKLYYEELLAEEFAQYLNNQAEYESDNNERGIIGFFRKLWKWIKNLFISN